MHTRPARLGPLLPSTSSSSRHRRQAMSSTAFKSSDLPFELLFVGLTHKLCHPNVAPTSLNHHWITCFQSKRLEISRILLASLKSGGTIWGILPFSITHLIISCPSHGCTDYMTLESIGNRSIAHWEGGPAANRVQI